ncbi:unnamed protein product [Allacma fusca]|uniref:F-box domain-containing protein n=1 Tax=Allacma fusca TaxID=39272 RepID=A0A8J2MAQ5_9HEXA|nr:unnamed protein product [Allacma fusca]
MVVPVSYCSAATGVFCNHLVLKQIFMSLDPRTLVRLSLVNKLWCSTARSVLRSKKCLAIIKGLHPCQELLSLNGVLCSSHDIPYTGLKLKVSQHYTRYIDPVDLGEHAFDPLFNEVVEGQHSENEDEDVLQSQPATIEPVQNLNDVSQSHSSIHLQLPQCYLSILEKLPYRHFEFQWDYMSNNCPAQWLLIKILKEKRHQIEELAVYDMPDNIVSLRRYLRIKDVHWLPALTILDIRVLEQNSINLQFKFQLMQAAPNLKILLGSANEFDVCFFLNNDKLSVMHYFNCNYDPNRLFRNGDQYIQNDTFLRYATARPNINQLNIRGPFDNCEAIPDTKIFMQEILTTLCTSCALTLTKIKVDQIHLMMLLPIQPESQPMVNVKRMQLFLNESLDTTVGANCLQKFNWNGWFPGLELIEVSTGAQTDYYLQHWPVGEIMERQTNFVCTSVSKIIFLLSDWDFEGLEYFRNLFPNVTNFFNVSPSRIEKMLKFLWVTWPKLETIGLYQVFDSAITKNLDSIFCGISQEQVDSYIKAESLDGVELRPQLPSILDLQQLKQFHISMRHRGAFNKPKEPCEKKQQDRAHLFFLTHVTAKLALARMPGLDLRIETDVCEQTEDCCAFTFEHLKPYVTVIS